MSVSHKQEKWAGKHPAHNSILRQRNTIFPKSFLPNVLWNELFKAIYWKEDENPSLQKRSIMNALFTLQELQHSLPEKVLLFSIYGVWLSVLFLWIWKFGCHPFKHWFCVQKPKLEIAKCRGTTAKFSLSAGVTEPLCSNLTSLGMSHCCLSQISFLFIPDIITDAEAQGWQLRGSMWDLCCGLSLQSHWCHGQSQPWALTPLPAFPDSQFPSLKYFVFQGPRGWEERWIWTRSSPQNLLCRSCSHSSGSMVHQFIWLAGLVEGLKSSPENQNQKKIHMWGCLYLSKASLIWELSSSTFNFI